MDLLDEAKTVIELIVMAYEVIQFVRERLELVKTNRHQVKRLLVRIEHVETALKSFKSDERIGLMGRQLTGLHGLFLKIRGFVDKLTKYKYLELLFHGGSISEQLTEFSCELRERCDDLQFSTVMELKLWTEQDRKDIASDDRELKAILDQIEKGQDKILDMLNMNQNQVLSNLHELHAKIEGNIYSGGHERLIAEAVARALHCYSRKKRLSQVTPTKEFDWIIERDTVVFGAKIGSGGFSNVFAAKYLNSEVAAKVFEISDPGELEVIMHEAKIWQSLRHDSVVPLLGVCLDTSRPFIISQFCKNGTIKGFLKKNDHDPGLCFKFMQVLAIRL